MTELPRTISLARLRRLQELASHHPRDWMDEEHAADRELRELLSRGNVEALMRAALALREIAEGRLDHRIESSKGALNRGRCVVVDALAAVKAGNDAERKRSGGRALNLENTRLLLAIHAQPSGLKVLARGMTDRKRLETSHTLRRFRVSGLLRIVEQASTPGVGGHPSNVYALTPYGLDRLRYAVKLNGLPDLLEPSKI